jgi:hypothetical protein
MAANLPRKYRAMLSKLFGLPTSAVPSFLGAIVHAKCRGKDDHKPLPEHILTFLSRHRHPANTFSKPPPKSRDWTPLMTPVRTTHHSRPTLESEKWRSLHTPQN